VEFVISTHTTKIQKATPIYSSIASVFLVFYYLLIRATRHRRAVAGLDKHSEWITTMDSKQVAELNKI